MTFDFAEAHDVLCDCGAKLFEVRPGKFELNSSRIECSTCHEVSQVTDLLVALADSAREQQ